ncbi:ABC transporter permease [Taibaiella lutea]|uniref:ABC transporter permease n=1 Tax=Taibaiella lutea TaxID=2608001 RepID=UPI00167FDEC2|nr:ABC transporter permease [Taibaiella lutea]
MFATIRKEFLLLIRDPGGLLLLLIMPAALIIVMALVQEAPYKDYQEMKFDILVINNDKGDVGKKIVEQIGMSKNFVVIDSADNDILNDKSFKENLRNGKYKMGIIIPEDATKTMVNMSNKVANQLAASMQLPAALPVNNIIKSTDIELVFDPVVKPSFRSSLTFALNEYISKVKMEVLLGRLSKLNGANNATPVDLSTFQGLSVIERSLDNGQQLKQVNSTQHNVPAWTIFGMFLIVVPISGNMIRERDEGSDVRIKLIPNANTPVSIGKIVFYILVCVFQFFVMTWVGVYLLPVFGLQSFTLGLHPWLLIPVALSIAFAAVSYGYFVGSVFKTANQAMPVGAISVVLFSAMGGVWVPIEILPNLMRKVAMVSPLHWSLEGVNQVVIRNGNIGAVMPSLLIMLAIGGFLCALPMLFSRK